MIKTPKIILIFVPAILIVSLALFVRIIQYRPARTIEKENMTNDQNLVTIPIYPEDPILGYKKASQTLIIFEDFGCESCAAQTKILDDLIKQYPKAVKMIIKGLPVTKFPLSTELAHQYGYCLNKQEKFYEFSQLAFSNKDNLSLSTLESIVERLEINKTKLQDCLNSNSTKEYLEINKQLAMALNIQAVPTIFLNNKQIIPPTNLEDWKIILGLE